MCGINGIAYSPESGKKVDEALLVRMRDVMRYRGPDGSGEFVKGNIGLGHRRLSIVDLSTGDQPMFNADGSCVIVYNGEVYDHADHRPGLIDRGYIYTSTSDTETILHLYEEFGSECLKKLRGMFAFAIWNERERELLLARDRFGVKPLYYCHDDEGSLFFASEIKAILESGAVPARLNYSALPDQFANHGTSGEVTLFEGIKRLLPGHFLVWKDGGITIEQYWDLSFEPKVAVSSDADCVAEWHERFRESVKLRLMSDVALGMFLSGGIDSSAIAAVMSELVDEPIKTFSVGFSEDSANEFSYARQAAKAFRTDHHEITITAEQFFEALPELVWHEDEPLGFEASVPLFFVSKLAQERVKVVLTGEGSDETLAGYGRYWKALKLLDYGGKYEAVTPGLLRDAVRSGVAALPGALNRKLKRTFLSLETDVENIYFDNFAIFGKQLQRRLFTDTAYEQMGDAGPYRGLHQWLAETDASSTLDKLLYVDTKTYLHELLMKQDQMSMAASVESRVPFLDHKMVEFTARLPERMKLRGRTTKWILREAMKGILPNEIIDRPKMGFPVPIGEWFCGKARSVIDEFVLSERVISRGLFDPGFLSELVAAHDNGEDHASRLFRLVTFEMWMRKFIDK